LDVMLPHLEHIRRKPAKPRRTRHRPHAPRTEHDRPHQGPSAEVEARSASRSDALEDPLRKGKGRTTFSAPPPNPPQIASTSRRDPVEVKPPQAWWLDVASPSWEDMRTLGKVSNSPFLLLTVRLIRGTAVASSPTDPGGYPTAGTARET
jgi:magnesium transporter